MLCYNSSRCQGRRHHSPPLRARAQTRHSPDEQAGERSIWVQSKNWWLKPNSELSFLFVTFSPKLQRLLGPTHHSPSQDSGGECWDLGHQLPGQCLPQSEREDAGMRLSELRERERASCFLAFISAHCFLLFGQLLGKPSLLPHYSVTAFKAFDSRPCKKIIGSPSTVLRLATIINMLVADSQEFRFMRSSFPTHKLLQTDQSFASHPLCRTYLRTSRSGALAVAVTELFSESITQRTDLDPTM